VICMGAMLMEKSTRGRVPRPEPTDPVADLEEAAELRRGVQGPERRSGALEDQARQWSAERSFAALRDVACSITSNLSLRSLVIQILDIAIHAVGAERGIVFMGDASDRELVPVVARSVRGQDVQQLERISRTILRHSQLGRPVVTEDATRDPLLHTIPSVMMQQIRSVICLPMTVRGEPVGAIYVDAPSRAQAFPQHAERFLEAFASLAAVALENARLHGETLHENARLRRQLSAQEAFGRLVTVSPSMTALLKRASMLVPAETPVMIVGESGTGKELLARSIHEAGARLLNPFVAYNCAAIPRDLMESIFFGHVRGAFTGAVRAMPGLFRQADQGTLFLDEIAELDFGLQAKLLRVIEDGIVRPLGSDEEFHVDVRLIAATSRDIRAAVREGRFREELYYRINVIELAVPPLRDRLDDIPVLVDHFLRKHGSGRPEGRQVTLTKRAMNYLQSLPWPGNVRELENLVRRILVLCEPGPQDAERLRGLVSPRPDDDSSESAGAPAQQVAAPITLITKEPPADERQEIIDVLRRAKGKRAVAARMLGIHRNVLLRRMEKLGIERE
jgi:serine/threonine-protein kinase PknK